jgi:monoterpene epsilon-lactone hydrolase
VKRAHALSRSGRRLFALLVGVAILASHTESRRSTPDDSQPTIDDDGTLHVRGESIPYSGLASAEARRDYIRSFRSNERLSNESKSGETRIERMRERLDQALIIPGLTRLRKVFPVEITPARIGGVQTDVIVPADGIAPSNRHRILINLHGGGFEVGARYGGQMESVPISSLGSIKVITVDYRMAPEWQFPAASEDVEKVYVELLKSYRPENIGIFGCSAGALLTGEATAWFLAKGLPLPGAIGLFGEGPFIGSFGDSNYMFTGGKPHVELKSVTQNPYLKGVNWKDPLVSPAADGSILQKFPPTLLISGTRDVGLSQVVYTHSRLVDLGVDSALHIWEGAGHCSFAQPIVDPEVPENRQVWKVVTRFFDRHLGTKER